MWPTAKTATWGMTEHGPGQMRWVGMYATLRNRKLQPILKLCRKEWKWDWLSTTIAGLWPVRTGMTQRSAELVLPFCGATTCQPKSGSDSLSIPSLKKHYMGVSENGVYHPNGICFFLRATDDWPVDLWVFKQDLQGAQPKDSRGTAVLRRTDRKGKWVELIFLW